MSTTCFLMFPVFRHECRGGGGFPVRFPGYFVNTTLAVPSLRLPRVTTTRTPRRAEARTTCAAHSSVCLHYKPQAFPPSQMSQFCFFCMVVLCLFFSFSSESFHSRIDRHFRNEMCWGHLAQELSPLHVPGFQASGLAVPGGWDFRSRFILCLMRGGSSLENICCF